MSVLSPRHMEAGIGWIDNVARGGNNLTTMSHLIVCFINRRRFAPRAVSREVFSEMS